MLKLRVLTDNNTIIDRYYTGEPGLSFFIEADGKKILFDTGYSDVFIRNAQLMGIDLTDIDVVALSHGHNDHTWGICELTRLYNRLMAERRPMLLAHPAAFERKRCGGLEIGMNMTEETLSAWFDVKKSREPVKLTQNLIWLGEIPRTVEKSEAVGTHCEGGRETPDYCRDDTAMAYGGAEGLVIITGCSHSGICNIIDYARKVTGRNTVIDVIGGFHLLDITENRMDGIIAWMRQNPPKMMHPCHCTDLKAKAALLAKFDIRETGTGEELEYR